ncbi:MAG TPA: toll/interleukin-1 receptor domain-containing protein [Pyrinomonadaceae bacterium]|nr:toll/interleukin-1 receptor domain-containing protein [Pyrinomonadaceae bacterium]
MNLQQIFISHAASDREWAREFAAAIHDLGVNVWFDEFNIRPGDHVTDLLEKGLRESDVVVLPITRESLGNSNFFFELGAAIAMNKKIIPIVAEDIDYSQLPLSLSRVSVLKRRSPKETAEELAKALKIPHDEAA